MPLWRRRAGHGNEVRLLFARQFAALSRTPPLVESLQALLNEALASALDRRLPNRESRGNLFIGETFGSFEQNTRSGDLANRLFTASEKRE